MVTPKHRMLSKRLFNQERDFFNKLLQERWATMSLDTQMDIIDHLLPKADKINMVAERLARAEAHPTPTPSIVPGMEWRQSEFAPKDGDSIIYLHPGHTSQGYKDKFVSTCEWCEADEGVQQGWWDDALSEYVAFEWWLCKTPKLPE